jgi:cell division protein FtsL
MVALALAGFVAVGLGVNYRRYYGRRQQIELSRLTNDRQALVVARARLEQEIRDASSRTHLGPIVEQRLRMYVPPPQQIITLPRPPRAENPPDGR